jgi:orotate phosphoribosyltransferase
MAGFEHLEEWVVGLYDRNILGCARDPEEFIKLKSGRMSPHYANFRGVMSVDYDHTHDGMSYEQQMRIRLLTVKAGSFVLDKISASTFFDHVAPIPQAVTQLGGAIALDSNRSCLNVRVKEGEKGYGKHNPVEGSYCEGDIVIGFDDVVTTGDAKREFLEPMDHAGLVVPGFAVLLDREEGGRVNIAETGYELTAAVGMYAVKDILFENNRINSDQLGFIEDYLGEYGDLAA